MSVATAESVAEEQPVESVGLFTHVMSYDDLTVERSRTVASLGVATRRVVFGRELGPSGDAQLVELADPHASRTHAIAHRDRSADWLENKSSKGTFVNGVRIDRTVELEDGARIDMGHSLLCYRRVTPDMAVRLRAVTLPPVVGLSPTRSPRVLRLLDEIELFAECATPLLILGPRGSGKEHIARQIHERSRRTGAFVSVDCGAVHEGIFAPEFFGVARGGVQQLNERSGFIRSAHRGTLFLDEFGNLALESQLRLLRVFQTQRVRPVGSDAESGVDVRLIAATNRDIFDAERFPSDLVDRLAGYVLFVPSLMERIEDFGVLVAHGLRENGLQAAAIRPAAARHLFAASFPGNIRQLAHVMAALVRVARGQPITEAHLQEPSILALLREGVDRAGERPAQAGMSPQPPIGEPDALRTPARPPRSADPGRERILAVLERAGSTLRAAEMLQVPERSLRRWMKQHAIK